ncbi:MAG TPA: CBS domain-containing protein [Kiritimatiellia bacterium]|jgi:CBS domain-containing protein
MKLGRILELKANKDTYTVAWDTYVGDFIRAALKKNIGAMPVVDDQGEIVGIITERDVFRNCERGESNFNQTHVVSIMTRDVIMAQVDDDITKAMDLMIKGKMRHLPVLNGKKFAGMLTIRDLIFALRSVNDDEMRKLLEFLRSELEWRHTSTQSFTPP